MNAPCVSALIIQIMGNDATKEHPGPASNWTLIAVPVTLAMLTDTQSTTYNTANTVRPDHVLRDDSTSRTGLSCSRSHEASPEVRSTKPHSQFDGHAVQVAGDLGRALVRNMCCLLSTCVPAIAHRRRGTTPPRSRQDDCPSSIPVKRVIQAIVTSSGIPAVRALTVRRLPIPRKISIVRACTPLALGYLEIQYAVPAPST